VDRSFSSMVGAQVKVCLLVTRRQVVITRFLLGPSKAARYRACIETLYSYNIRIEVCMRAKLKQLRVQAEMTQARLASLVGVTQPNYQRWEAGAATIPAAKLKKLAKVLKASPDLILGRHPPVEVSLYDDSVSDELSYYGEVSIHFCGGGAPLLLSISERAFSSMHRDLQLDVAFVTVESLANQTVVIRMKAIADVYFSSEAYDDYGPEHGSYANHVDLQIPDARDWEIIEALAAGEIGIENFDPANVQRVREMIMITDDQYEKLVADGLIKIEDLESERAKNQTKTDLILEMAYKTTYQLSTGQRRSVYVDNPEDIFNAFCDLIDFEEDKPADDMIRVEAEGRHRVIFINKHAMDYVIIPTHRYNKGRVDAADYALRT
jgi:transcriptional regulator with XRE-family HTH domain